MLSNKRTIERSHRGKPKTPKLDIDANDEWLKIESTSKINEVKHVPMSIFKPRSLTREYDIRDMSENDLESLETTDPFLYYSIPGVRAAKVALKDVDHSDVDALCRAMSNASVTKSQPPLAGSTRVARRSCVSFECHASVLMEDVLVELDDLSDDELLFSDEDELLAFLSK